MIHRAFLLACGALLVGACTVVEKDDDDEDDSDAGSGGRTASGGATSGGSGSGGRASGGSDSGGRASSGSGGDAAGGEAGDGGPDADAAPVGDAAPEGATGDASDGAIDPFADGGVCAPDSDPCSTCIKTSCCTEWLACNDDACAGDGGSDLGELVRFQSCVVAALQSDGGTASIATCRAAAAAAGGALAANTGDLVDCMVAGQRCSTECFGGDVAP